MAQTLMSKIRVGILGSAHTLMNRFLDLTSISSVSQFLRDAETSLRQLRDSVAEERGRSVGAARNVEAQEAKINELNTDIEALLTDEDDSNDHLATTLEAELMGVEENLELNREMLVSTNETVDVLTNTLSALRGKVATMRMQLKKLKALEARSDAKERAVDALDGASGAMATGADASIDSIANRIQERADAADAKLAMAQESFEGAVGNDSTMATVAARLARRKQQLAAKREEELEEVS